MRPKQQQGQQKPPPPPPPPTVRISFDDADGRGAGDSLKIDWFAAELPEEVRSHPGSPLFVVVDGEKEEGAEPRLSIEPVLLNVVAMHATHAMLQIYEALTADSSPLDINDVELVMPAADGDDDDTDDPAKGKHRFLRPRGHLIRVLHKSATFPCNGDAATEHRQQCLAPESLTMRLAQSRSCDTASSQGSIWKPISTPTVAVSTCATSLRPLSQPLERLDCAMLQLASTTIAAMRARCSSVSGLGSVCFSMSILMACIQLVD